MAAMDPMMGGMMGGAGANPMAPNADITQEAKKEAGKEMPLKRLFLDSLSVVAHTFAFENADKDLLALWS